MRRHIVLGGIFLCACLVFQPEAGANSRGKDRIEKLFVWRVSDSLKLNDTDEKKLSAALEKVSRAKSEASARLSKVIDDLKGGKLSKKQSLEKISEYEEALEEYLKAQMNEVREIKIVLGEERLGDYLVLKHDFTDKLKNLLSQADGSSAPKKKTKLGEPQIIEGN